MAVDGGTQRGADVPGPDAVAGPPRGRRRPGRRLVVALVAVVVLVAAAVVAVVLLTRTGPDPGRPVADYLQALADGHAADALAQGPAPASTAFLTDDALRAQQRVARITDIRVATPTVSGTRAQVRATYRFGTRAVDTSFDLVRAGARWQLTATVYPVDVAAVTDIPGLTLMGRPTAGTRTAYVFPGPLVWGSTLRFLTVSEQDPASFPTSAAAAGSSRSTLQAGLTDAGRAAVTAAVTRYLAGCAASTSLAPPACPQAQFDASGIDGSARWTAPTDLHTLTYLTGSPAANVSVSGDLTWSVTYQARPAGGTGAPVPRTAAGVDGPLYGTVDLTAPTPAYTPG